MKSSHACKHACICTFTTEHMHVRARILSQTCRDIRSHAQQAQIRALCQALTLSCTDAVTLIKSPHAWADAHSVTQKTDASVGPAAIFLNQQLDKNFSKLYYGGSQFQLQPPQAIPRRCPILLKRFESICENCNLNRPNHNVMDRFI